MEKPKPTLLQLKALAYDCISNKEIWERRLIEINHEINNFKEEAPVETQIVEKENNTE